MRRQDVPVSMAEIQEVLADCRDELDTVPVPDVTNAVHRKIQGQSTVARGDAMHDAAPQQPATLADLSPGGFQLDDKPDVIVDVFPSRAVWKKEVLKVIAGGVVFAMLAGSLIFAFEVLLEGAGNPVAPAASDLSELGGDSTAYALIVEDGLGERTLTSEVVAFNESSGEVIARLETGDEPNVVLDPSGHRLYLLQTRWDTPRNGIHALSVIDTKTWEEFDSTTVTDRIMYNLAGPSSLVLSPDGTRLLIYSTNARGDYWLQVFDVATFDHISDITLPRGCGGTQVVATQNELVMLCGITPEGNDEEGIIGTELALQFIDINAGRISATIPVPTSRVVEGHTAGVTVRKPTGRPVGLVANGAGSKIYVVSDRLGIMEFDTTTHELTRDVTTWLHDKPVVFGLERSGKYLLAGVASDLTYWEDMKLWRFELPTLTLSGERLSVQEHPRMAAGPGNELYQWERSSTDLRRLDLDDGSVTQIHLGGEKELIAGIVRSE